MSDVLVYPYRYPTVFTPISDPSQLAGLVGWWQSTAAATITSSATLVSQWANKVVAGPHLTQTVNANKPKTGTRTFGGLNVIDFDGTDLFTSTLAVNHPLTIVVAFAHDGTGSGTNRGLIGGIGNTVQIYADTNGAYIVSGNGGHYTATTVDTGRHVLTYAAGATGDASTLRFDGNLADAWTSGATFPLNQLSVGGFGGAGQWDGMVSDVIVYNRALSDTECAQVEAWLAAPPITPPDLSGLARWYKADDAVTVIASAGSVSQWTDKAGGNDNLTQATAGLRPVTGTRTLNGRNVLDFDGAGDYLAAGTALPLPLTTFIVARSDIATTAVERTILAGSGNTCALNVDTGEQFYVYMGGPSNFMFWGGGANLLNLNAHIFAFTLSDTAASTSRLDGVEIVATGAGSFGSNQTTVGGGASAATWDGIIGEVIQYSRVLTSTELDQIELYLATQWGISGDFSLLGGGGEEESLVEIEGGTPSLPEIDFDWSPAELPGVLFWIDPSDETSVTVEGGVVTQVADQTGGEAHFHAGPSNPPSSGLDTINGRNALGFAGDQLVHDAPGDALDVSRFTILFVARLDSGDVGDRIVAFWDGSGNDSDAGSALVYHSAFAPTPNVSIYAETQGPTVVAPVGVAFRGRVAKQGARCLVAVDDDVVEADVVGSTLNLVAHVYLGHTSTSTHGFHGTLGEVVVTNLPIEGDDLANWEAYVANKWGV